MIAVADFLIKVIICSGLLTGFYWIALRNKLFHQWNRYYLIAVVAVSLCIPFIKITLTQTATTSPVTYQALQTVTTNEAWIEDSQIAQENGKTFFTSENILLLLYALVSLLVLLMTIAALLKIGRLLKANQKWKIDSLTFVETDAKGTPFSFFRFLFWNNAIDFHSEKGQQIFAHELIHVEEKHSADKLLMQLVLIVFWINPFFWLIRKELTMIHEFIADQKSVKNHDTASFAAMILASVYPTVNFPMTNSFFYSPIKRRLLMLSKLQNPKVSYFSRLLLLPLLTLIFFAFVLKTKTVTKQERVPKLDKQITVVIDAAHGFKDGKPDGPIGLNGISEDEISLAISKKIEVLNKDKNLKLIFTRTSNDAIGLRERTNFAIENKADLFISIHANYSPQLREGNKYIENPSNGFEMYVARDEFPFVAESKELASNIVTEMQGIIAVREPAIKQRQKGIWVLQNTNCPAVIVECGFISNKKDAAFLSEEKNQEKMAEAILRGIKKYVSENNNIITTNDTIPVSEKTFKENKPLYIINGKRVKAEEFERRIISSDKVTVIKANNQAAIIKYGPDAKNGVMIFDNAIISNQSNRDTLPQANDDENIVFTKTEIEAQFPGGETKWNEYIRKITSENLNELVKDKKSGTCEVHFIITKDGNVKNIEALTMKGSKWAEIIIEAIKKGPKWIPAVQNGHKVTAWKNVSTILKLPDINELEEKNKAEPSVTLNGEKPGKISAEKFINLNQLIITDEWEIKGYTLLFAGEGFPQVKYVHINNSGTLTNKVIELIKQSKEGTSVVIDEVTAVSRETGIVKRIRPVLYNLY